MNPFINVANSGYDILNKYKSSYLELGKLYNEDNENWWTNSFDVKNNLIDNEKYNILLIFINFLLDDNLISEKEHNLIIKLTKALSINIAEFKKQKFSDINRIVSLQFHLYLLDDEIDSEELKEVNYMQDIFDFGFDEIFKIIDAQSQQNQKQNEDPCYVYLMVDTTNNYYKIGISSNPDYREKTLQSEKPTIEMVASKSYPNRKIASTIEKAFHNAYKASNIRGEWFNLNVSEIQNIVNILN